MKTECGEIYIVLRGEKDCIDKIKAKIASMTEYEEVIAMDWRWGNEVKNLKIGGKKNERRR